MDSELIRVDEVSTEAVQIMNSRLSASSKYLSD